jgi:intein-encoded DNA endonuclease-like protein
MKPGPKPKKIIEEKWTSELAYAIGLLTTDGCLSRKTNLIDLTSKDTEQLTNFLKCLGIKLNIGQKLNGSGQTSSRVQFKNVIFYNFLIKIGLKPAKSRTLGPLKIPNKYFFDFLRGCFDGDGYSYSYWDPRWKSSFMFYIGFVSASRKFIYWIRKKINTSLKIKGHITTAKKKKVH